MGCFRFHGAIGVWSREALVECFDVSQGPWDFFLRVLWCFNCKSPRYLPYSVQAHEYDIISLWTTTCSIDSCIQASKINILFMQRPWLSSCKDPSSDPDDLNREQTSQEEENRPLFHLYEETEWDIQQWHIPLRSVSILIFIHLVIFSAARLLGWIINALWKKRDTKISLSALWSFFPQLAPDWTKKLLQTLESQRNLGLVNRSLVPFKDSDGADAEQLTHDGDSTPWVWDAPWTPSCYGMHFILFSSHAFSEMLGPDLAQTRVDELFLFFALTSLAS